MQIGDIVRSLQGRDAGQIYLVVGVTTERILLADGERRTPRRPKAKNPRHIAALATADAQTLERLQAGRPPSDDEIRQLIGALMEKEGGDADAER